MSRRKADALTGAHKGGDKRGGLENRPIPRNVFVESLNSKKTINSSSNPVYFGQQ